jgi:hypothetical protein
MPHLHVKGQISLVKNPNPRYIQIGSALVRQAIREGWPILPWVGDAIVRDVLAVLDDPAARPRMEIAAIRTLIAMEADNLRRLLVGPSGHSQAGKSEHPE